MCGDAGIVTGECVLYITNIEKIMSSRWPKVQI